MRCAVWLLLAVFLVSWSACVWASISASEAISWIEDSHFLKEHDRLETPSVKMLHAEKGYWLVPVVAGESVATFFPVSAAKEELSSNDAVNNQLFSVSKFLRDYLVYRNTQAQKGARWFVGRDNVLILSQLADDLRSEKNQLNIVKERLAVSESVSHIGKMQQALERMSVLASDLSEETDAAVDAEASFTTTPSSSNLQSVPDSFASVFETLAALSEEARVYRDDVLNLKQVIGSSNLDLGDQTQLSALADAPRSLFSIGSAPIGNWVVSMQDNKDFVAGLLVEARSKSFLDSAKAELEKRVKRGTAFQALYDADPDFSSDTDYPSLAVAINDLQSVDKKDFWQNQEQLQVAITQFNEAERLMNTESFDLSLVATQRAKRAVALVIADGFVPENQSEIDFSNLINILILVLIAAIILLAIKNRDKILGSGAPATQEETGMGYGWRKI